MTVDAEIRLAAIAGLIREAELLRVRRAELDQRLAEQAAALSELRRHWAGEVRDVERLEGFSLSRVLVALRGAHAGQLSRERAEADAARYRVAEGQSQLAAIGAERAAVEARLSGLTNLPARFAAAVDAKERQLRREGGPELARLLALAEQRGRVEAELRELAEAGAAAEAAAQALGEVRRQLDLAADRKSADNWLGGALLAGKPNWLDGVAWAAAHADRCVAVLHTELGEVGLARPLGNTPARAPVAVRPTGFLETVFSEVFVKDQLNRARNNVDRSAHLVAGVRQDVARRTGVARAYRDAVLRERQNLLAS